MTKHTVSFGVILTVLMLPLAVHAQPKGVTENPP